MLYDRARIFVAAGAGGDGCVSFRREAFVPRGGPDGGDGGRGGDVVVLCTASLRDLRALRHRRQFRAGNGAPGSSQQRHGSKGADLVLRVPPGTIFRGVDGDLAGREIELLRDGERQVLAKGGAGGRGNKRFANPKRQAPRFAERGLTGESGWVEVQLKLLADVGLVGLPNAGKSSLLRALTAAEPKVAPYPFTTLEPVLGVLERDHRQLVIADIPGLIEGASEGAGLGDQFLAHIERTNLLVHLVDLAPELSGAVEDPIEGIVAQLQTVERELAAYSPRLAGLPRLVALSKADLVDEERVAQATARLQGLGFDRERVVAISSATRQGLEELVRLIFASYSPPAAEPAEQAEPQPPATDLVAELIASGRPLTGDGGGGQKLQPKGAPEVTVERAEEGQFRLGGEAVELLARRFDLAQPEARAYVAGRLRRWGALGALKAAGWAPGEPVLVGDQPVAIGED